MIQDERKNYPFDLVSVFSDVPYKGNPVYVVHLNSAIGDGLKAELARHLRLSEVTFIENVADASGELREYRVDVYNPQGRMEFAGHPLLGTAASIGRRYGVSRGVMNTGTRLVPFEYWPQQSGLCRIEVPPFRRRSYMRSADLADVVDAPMRSRCFPIYDVGPRHVLVELANKDAVEHVSVDYEALRSFKDIALHCFAWDGDGVENRMFSPAYGVYEDAGTGSVVAPFLHEARLSQPDRTSLLIRQGTFIGSECRMRATWQVDEKKYFIEGQTVKCGEGWLCL